MKLDIKDLSKKELEDALAELGAERYRASQILRWLYKCNVRQFDEMTDVSQDLREALKKKFRISRLTELDSRLSKIDGTAKYLLMLEDSNALEAVFLPEKRRNTVCISSQVGCKFACSFCASAPFGFARNLKASEILDEILFIIGKSKSQITNVVFMGIGEPLDNYENVLKAIRIINDKDGLNIGARKITISTCGIVPGIERLKDEKLQIELSVSLHSAIDLVRDKLLPINKRYPIKDLIRACRDYIEATNRIITFEYVLIKDTNSSKDDALTLAGLLGGMKCKVNTIFCNQIPARGYLPPALTDARAFIRTLRDNGINAIHRKSKGFDIEAACGQLRITQI